MYLSNIQILISLLPLIGLILYHLFKNKTSNPKDVTEFFENFKVGGHRGSPIMRPENTMESFEKAKSEGVDLIEFDLSLTKDKVCVILHDDTLDRTTNMKGNIRNYTFNELKKANAAAKFNWPSGETIFETGIPLLKDVVQFAKNKNLKMLFDIKDTDDELVDQLLKLFKSENLYNNTIICSFFPQVIYKIKSADPQILVGYTWRRYFFSYNDIQNLHPRFNFPLHYIALMLDFINIWSIKTFLPSFLGVDMLLTERSEISERFVTSNLAAGIKVCSWTVNDLNEMRWMQNILQIPILTDKPFLIEDLPY
ncbi:Glycerophosphodiester phosphodiesterase 1 [Strongyloides ratti]|uniref:Glycerophosphodiester phosphodiesterase 1 n=1 Tax=Strongyloides ratti TaxID=34506 RepID=A0A090LK72_STRRB|nr:Glycerophosphodiester phosphodiesterase 1 [Strongyloides ratti]CEF67945.1 Glycerophosphodiester phosphodiesterase 1 [Strongyloides ratti]